MYIDLNNSYKNDVLTITFLIVANIIYSDNMKSDNKMN